MSSIQPYTAPVDLPPINNFEGNAGSFRGGRNRGSAAASQPCAVSGATIKIGAANPNAFQAFREKKRAASGKTAPKRDEQVLPTAERLDKLDRPSKTVHGCFRARHPLERLRDQGKLDTMPHIANAMFQAAEKLYAHFYQAGLGGIRAQDISRTVGSGDGGSCHMPINERAAHHRKQFRIACTLMGWHEAAPLQGAGRLVVDVVCYELAIKDAAHMHVPGARAETVLAAGMDRLRQGLFALAVLWKLF